jgi:hypothetical protein
MTAAPQNRVTSHGTSAQLRAASPQADERQQRIDTQWLFGFDFVKRFELRKNGGSQRGSATTRSMAPRVITPSPHAIVRLNEPRRATLAAAVRSRSSRA